MKHVKTIIIVALFLIIMGMLGYDTKLKEDTSKEIKTYKDSVELIFYINQLIEEENDSLINISDSLAALPPKIKTIYREKYIVIEHSDIDQLDSIVRAEFR